MKTKITMIALALLALAAGAEPRPMPDNWEAKDFLGRPAEDVAAQLGLPRDDAQLVHPDGVAFKIKDGWVEMVVENLPPNTDDKAAFALLEKRASGPLGAPTLDEAPKRVVWGPYPYLVCGARLLGEPARHVSLRPAYTQAVWITEKPRAVQPDRSAPWYK